MPWTKPDTLNAKYYSAFHEKTYEDAARIAANFQVLTNPPLRQWRYRKDDKKVGEASGLVSAGVRRSFVERVSSLRHLVCAGFAQLHGLGLVSSDLRRS